MQELLSTIDHFIQANQLIVANDTIIVGLSGGPDSVFLLHVLERYRASHTIKLIAAHLNHEWREDAHQDAALCAEMCKKLNIPLVTQTASQLNITIKNNGSKEEIGRKMRRHFFQTVAKEFHAHSIALGHHANDQQETFFIRLLRGSTLSGLTCMKPQEDLYIRPLLQTSKSAILDYVHQNNIPYVLDSSNESNAFLRNRVRTNVIPALVQCDDRFEKQFARTLGHLSDAHEFLNKLTVETFMHNAKKHNESWHINTTSFLALDSFMQKRIMAHVLIEEKVPMVLTEQFLDEIIRFLKNSSKKNHLIHESWLIERTKNSFFILKPTDFP